MRQELIRRGYDSINKYLYIGAYVVLLLLVELPYYVEYTQVTGFHPMILGVSLEQDSVDIRAILMYLIPWVFLHMVVGSYLYIESTRRECYVLPRMKSWKKWFVKHIVSVFRKVFGLIITYAIITYILILIFIPNSDWIVVSLMVGKGLVLTMGLACLFSTIQTFIILAFRSITVSYCLVMVIQCFSIILGSRYIAGAKYMIGNWSMYCRSGEMSEYGFSFSYALGFEILCILIILVAAHHVVKMMRKNG